MSEDRSIAVSHRAVYHMRQEILRLLADAQADRGGSATDRELEELASEWRGKYRTMRPDAACALVEKLATEPGPEPARFAVFVLAGLERRYGPSLWSTVCSLAGAIDDAALTRLTARRVAAPLLAKHPELLDSLETAAEPPVSRVAFLLAESCAALRVTAPEIVDRVEALLARE